MTSAMASVDRLLDPSQTAGETAATSGSSLQPSIRTRVNVPFTLAAGGFAPAEMMSFEGLCEPAEHLAVVINPAVLADPPLVRVHSECLTGDVFGSARCDCGAQLQESVGRMATDGGIILYLRQEGRGIGLYRKLDAYSLQDGGIDTFEANRRMNLPEDGRSYRAAAEMLLALGHPRIRLLSNNPDKAEQLARHGIEVTERLRTGLFVTPGNLEYLRAKAMRGGHIIPLAELEAR